MPDAAPEFEKILEYLEKREKHMPVRDLSEVRRRMEAKAKWAGYSQGSVHYASSEADRWRNDSPFHRMPCDKGGLLHGPGVITDGMRVRKCGRCGGDLNEHEHVFEFGYQHCVLCVPPPAPRDFHAEALEELAIYDPPAWLTDVPRLASNQRRRSSPWRRLLPTFVQAVLGAGFWTILNHFVLHVDWLLWP